MSQDNERPSTPTNQIRGHPSDDAKMCQNCLGFGHDIRDCASGNRNKRPENDEESALPTTPREQIRGKLPSNAPMCYKCLGFGHTPHECHRD